MFVYSRKHYIILIFLIITAGCFGGGIDKRGSVRDYRDGIVLTKGGSFRVGILPSPWKRRPFKYKAVLFSHPTKGSSISIDSFCKRSFDDAPLNILSNQLYYGMTKQKWKSRHKIQLDEREALRTVRGGLMDGVPIVLDTVVLKTNQCVFDFAYTSTPGDYRSGVSDFEKFYGGFHYIKGPRID